MANVLVVDDDPDSCEVARKLLASRGFGVKAAHNGKEALSAILEEKPDIVVLDLLMPQMDGPSLLEVIRSYLRLQSLPVVVWTGIEDGAAIERARRQGVGEVVIKGKDGLIDLAVAVQQELHRSSPPS